MARKNGGEQRPEYRLVLTTIGGAILPLGMLVFGAQDCMSSRLNIEAGRPTRACILSVRYPA